MTKFEYNLLIFILGIFSIYFIYAGINSIQFKRNPNTCVTTGFLVHYDKVSTKGFDEWSGIYEFYVNGKTYHTTSDYYSKFKFNIDEKIDIYYDESNPSINQASNNAYGNLKISIIPICFTIVVILLKKHDYS